MATIDRTLPTLPTIPLFDLDAIETSQGAERQQHIQKFGRALQDVGFLAVKAESVSLLFEGVVKDMRDFFYLPLDKRLSHFHDNGGQSGYCPRGTETAAGALVADNKHHYMVPPETASPLPHTSWRCYHKELTLVSAKVMSFLGEYLSEKTEDITESMKAATNLLRLIHYPAPSLGDDVRAVWAAAHEDLNALTLLPPATSPGLQLLTNEGKWLDVVVPEGYLIVNTGEQVERKTAGKIKATIHQVVNPGGQYAKAERFAAVFFGSWSSDYSLKPFESCKEEMTCAMSGEERQEYLSKYPDVCVKDALTSRLIEMGTIKNPEESLVEDLRGKGLLRKPTMELKGRYPYIFG